MTNGFYNVTDLDEDNKRSLIRNAVISSYTVDVQHLKDSMRRTINTDESIDGFIDKHIKDGTITVVNRIMYHKGTVPGDAGEVALCNSSNYLFCYMSIENLNKLVKKYKLKLTNW